MAVEKAIIVIHGLGLDSTQVMVNSKRTNLKAED